MTVRHDSFINNITEIRIEGKRGRGRPRRYLKQVKETVNVMSYQEVKLRADNRVR